MLAFLGKRASERKRRLFAAACCRRIWRLLNPEVSQPGVETIERFADGNATEEELAQVRQHALHYAKEAYGRSMRLGPRSPEGEIAYRDSQQAYLVADAASRGRDWLRMVLVNTSQCACRRSLGYRPVLTPKVLEEWDRLIQADHVLVSTLLRDIFNPFHPGTFDPTWLTSDVRALAGAAYEKRHLHRGLLDAVRLSVLADALEEAGCTDSALLEHLRSGGPHTRGCWAVDQVLSRE
jgi:hypothetical protein